MKLLTSKTNNYFGGSQFVKIHSSDASNDYSSNESMQLSNVMTTEEARRLTGLVAKTRAIFESANNNNEKSSITNSFNHKNSTQASSTSSASSFSKLGQNQQLINNNLKQLNYSNNANSIVNSNNLDQQELLLSKSNSLSNESDSDKENNARKFNSTSSNNIIRIKKQLLNINNDDDNVSITATRPTFLKLKPTISPHKDSSSRNQEDQHCSRPVAMSKFNFKKSHSSSKISGLYPTVAHSPVTSSSISASMMSENTNWPRSNQIVNEFADWPKSVKEAKSCFENLSNSSSTNSSSKQLNFKSRTSTPSLSHSVQAETNYKFKSGIKTYDCVDDMNGGGIMDGENKFKLESKLNKKKQSNGFKAGSVSEIVSLFSSSFLSTPSIQEISMNRKLLSNNNDSSRPARRQFNKSETTPNVFNTINTINNNDTSSLSSNSSSSSCQTTPRSNKDSNFKMANVMSKIKKLENVAVSNYERSSSSKIAKKEAKFSNGDLTETTSHSLDIVKTTSVFEKNKTQKSNCFTTSNNTVSSSSSISSFTSNPTIESINDKKSIYSYKSQSAAVKLHQLQQNQLNYSTHASSNTTGVNILTNNTNKYSQSPKFLQLFQNQMKISGDEAVMIERDTDDIVAISQRNYRKLEDIMNEADKNLANNKYQSNIKIEHETKTADDQLIYPNQVTSSSCSSSSSSPILNENSQAMLNEKTLENSNKINFMSTSSSESTSPSLCSAEKQSLYEPIMSNKVSSSTITFKSSANTYSKKYDSALELKSSQQNIRQPLYNQHSQEIDNLKVDSTSCVLPSKLKQRSQSVAESKVSPSQSADQFSESNTIESQKFQLSNKKASGFVKNAVAFSNGTYFSSSNSNGINNGLAKRVTRNANTAKEALLRWCRKMTEDYDNVTITNFSSSWSDGLAFCALIHHFMPDLFNYSKLNASNRKYNFELAFKLAEEKAGIVSLLDVNDMIEMGDSPDWKCVFTYVHSIYVRFKDMS